jgi:hypothetical protein
MQINDFSGDEPADARRSDGSGRPQRHPLLTLLTVLLFAECALLLAATGFLIVELLTVAPASYPSAVALTLLTAAAAGWLAAIAIGAARGRPWIRGAAIVWQVLQAAVAIGCFQGAFARPEIGWFLLVPALGTLVLLFTPPVVAATRRI